MPYSYPNNIPDYIDNLPVGAQKRFISAFNSAYEDGATDEEARIAGWTNVKRKYKKVDGNWIKKNMSVSLLGKAYCIPDDVIELPGKLPYIWVKLYNELIDNGNDCNFSREKSWNVVKKYIYNKDGKWRFKKLLSSEKLLKEKCSMNKSKLQIYSPNSEKDGLFKMFIPIRKDSLVTNDDGICYIKGVASSERLDRQGDVVMQSFIDKMKKTALNLPVFSDHKTDDENYLGNICKIDDSVDFIPTVELENPDENSKVKRLLKRLDKGVSLCYSVGGIVTKAVKVWSDEIGGMIRKVIDGDIHEISIVFIPALTGTDIGTVPLMTKKFNNDSFKNFDPSDDVHLELVKELEIDKSDISIDNNNRSEICETDEFFWSLFDKAIERYSDSFSKQPDINDVNIEDLYNSCFAIPTIKKYPFKFINEDGKKKVHYGLLDKSWKEANNDNNTKAISVLENIRKSLKLGEKSYEFSPDFRKILINTISDAVDAHEARDRLWKIYDEFVDAAYTVIFWSDSSMSEKKADILELASQLNKEIETLGETMAREVVVSMKSYSE